jgi:hypothetical protein
MKHYSQIGQDLWVIEKTQTKRNGYFIDMGAAHPITINNTYALETEWEWTGISYDIGPPRTHGIDRDVINTPEKYTHLWNEHRSTPIIVCDLLELNIEQSFIENNVPSVVDYISIDLYPPASHNVLYRLPLDNYSFKCITFEHDAYKGFEQEKQEAIDYMESKGYTLDKIYKQDCFFTFNL